MFRFDFIKSAVEKTAPVKPPVDSSKDIRPESKPVDNKDKDANTAEKIDDKKADDKKSDDKKTDDLVTDRDVLLYFLQFDEKTEKVYLKTVKRKLSDKQILLQTINQLIKGPSLYEEGKGYITAVPQNLRLRSVTINGKIAEIDFNNAIEEGATGDILLKRIQQIVYTATQFEDVDSIIIKIDGQRRKTIGGDGFSISGPLKRW
jgi:spore germination protein GerM